MPEKDPSTIAALTYMWVFLVATWGGVVNYVKKRRTGVIPRFSITEFVGEIVTSAFVGLMTFFMCQSAELDPMLSAALIGISGHMGSRAIFVFETALQKRFGG